MTTMTIPTKIGIRELELGLEDAPAFRTTLTDIRPVVGLLEEIGRISHNNGTKPISNVIVHGEYEDFTPADLAYDAELTLYTVFTQSSKGLATPFISYDRNHVTTGAEKVTLGQAKLIPFTQYGHNTLLQSLDDAGIAYRENPEDIDNHQEISLFGGNAVLNPIGLLESVIRDYEATGATNPDLSLENLRSGLTAAKRGIIPIHEYSRTSQRTIVIDDWVSGNIDQINKYLKTGETKGMQTYESSEWNILSKNFRD
jgi:hypothetical protein